MSRRQPGWCMVPRLCWWCVPVNACVSSIWTRVSYSASSVCCYGNDWPVKDRMVGRPKIGHPPTPERTEPEPEPWRDSRRRIRVRPFIYYSYTALYVLFDMKRHMGSRLRKGMGMWQRAIWSGERMGVVTSRGVRGGGRDRERHKGEEIRDMLCLCRCDGSHI